MDSQNSQSTVPDRALIDRMLGTTAWTPYVAAHGQGAWGYEAATPEGRMAVEIVIEHLVGCNGEAGIGAAGVSIEVPTDEGPKRYLVPGCEGTRIWREVETAATKAVKPLQPVRELD